MLLSLQLTVLPLQEMTERAKSEKARYEEALNAKKVSNSHTVVSGPAWLSLASHCLSVEGTTTEVLSSINSA
jgi:hypothetical protein